MPVSDPNRIRQWINQERYDLAWEVDGIESSVGIDRQDGVAFVVNGKIDGNALTDAGTQMGMAILGAVLHKDPKTALVIGLGTGESAGWLAEMRDIERVDVVELEPAIDEVARRCRELNWNVLEHPRVRRIYNDGREFVFTTDEKYDLVLSEPSNPYRAGVAVLYTTEFYEAVRERLKPGGMFIQWLQAYEVDESIVSTVLVTARSAFRARRGVADVAARSATCLLQHAARVFRCRVARTHCVGHGQRRTAEILVRRRPGGIFWDTLLQMRDGSTRFLEHRFSCAIPTTERFSNTASPRRSVTRRRFRWKKFAAVCRHAGFYRPSLTRSTAREPIDWTEVELRRQEANLLYNGQFSLALLPSPEHRELLGRV